VAEVAQWRERAALRGAMIESLPFDFWAMDAQGRYIAQNAINRGRWGDLIGKGMDTLSLSPEMRALWDEQDRKALSGEIVEEEYAFTREGKETIARKRIGPLRIGGEIAGIVSVNFDMTEQRRTEEALRFTQFSMDRATYPISWINSDGQFLYVNDAAVRFSGYTRDEMLSMRAADFEVEGVSEPWRDRWERLKQRGAIVIERMLRMKGGKTLRVEIVTNYIEYQGREYCCGFVRDVTQRHLMDHIMRVQRDLGLGLSVSANIEVALALCVQAAIDVAGMDCGSVYLAGKASDALRLAYAQGFRKEVAEVIVSLAGEARVDGVDAVDKNAVDRAAEEPPPYGDSSSLTASKSHSLVASPPDEGLCYSAAIPAYHEGQVVAWLTVASHTREEAPPKALREVLDTIAGRMGSVIVRRSAEEEKARIATELAELLATANAPIFRVVGNGRVDEWNWKAAELTGYSREEVLGRDFVEDFVGEECRATVREALRCATKGTQVADVDMFLNTKSGNRLEILLNLTTRGDTAGAIVGVVGIGQDITECRRLQKELLDVSAKEQHRIGQDLHDGLGQQLTGILYLSKSLATDLAAKGLSRERQSLDWQARAAEAEAIVDHVKQAIAQTRRLAHGLIPVELDAQGLVSALESLAATTSMLFNVVCRVLCKEQVLIHDNTVAEHVYHIAQEAVNNAVKHGQAREIELTLSADHGKGMLTVRDDGTGFARDENAAGGMGLRIIEQRARMMDGVLHIQSAPGQGTSLSCSFSFQENAES